MGQTTINIDIPKAIAKIVGMGPIPPHDELTEQIWKSLDDMGIPLTEADRVHIGIKVREWHLQLDQPKKPEKKQTQSERLTQLLFNRFGDAGWNADIPLLVRADTLSWFVKLIECGLETRRKEFRAEGKGRLGAAEATSLGSWCIDLEQLVDQIERKLSTDKPDDTEVEFRKTIFKRHNCFGFWKTNYEVMTLDQLLLALQEKKDARVKLIIRDLQNRNR